MNRDRGLYVLIGILLGFIAGYLLHEEMARRQPAPAGAFAAAAAGSSAGAGNPVGPATGAAGGGGPTPQIEQLRQYVEEHPDDADAVRLLGNLNFEIRNWERARDLYARYLTLEPRDPDVMTDLGVCYRETREYDRALGLFRQAQSLAPSHWQSRYNEVVVLAFDMNRPQEARRPLSELQRLQPDNPSVRELAAEIARLLGTA